jgi:hypothetical protein
VIIPFLAVSRALISLLVTALPYLGAPDFASRVFGPLWAKLIMRVALMNLRVVGREHLVAHQSYVIVANHQSLFDTLLLYGFLGLNIKWVMTKDVRQVPALGVACAAMGHILPTDSLDLRPGRATMAFGAPTSTRGHSSDELTSLMGMSRAVMLAQLGQCTEQNKP